MRKLRQYLLRLSLAGLLLLTPVSAEPQILFEGALTVDVPPTLRRLDDKSIAEMFASSSRLPQVVFATPDSETRVAFSFLNTPFLPEDVDPTREDLTNGLHSQPGIVWHKNHVVTLGGKLWFRLDYDLLEKQPPSHEILLGTSLNNQFLFVMIATPAADLELVSPEIEALLESLRPQSQP